MHPRDSAFRRYKVHVDIRGGSVVRGTQTSVGWSEPAIFHNFGRRIFRTFRVEANEVPYLLSSAPKMLDLE